MIRIHIFYSNFDECRLIGRYKMEKRNNEHAEKSYRALVLNSIDEKGWTRNVEDEAKKALKILRDDRKNDLATSWGLAMWTFVRTFFFIVAPIVAAVWLHRSGIWYGIPFAVFLSGLGMYGGISIVHDLSHRCFLPRPQANDFAGNLLAPLFLLDFASFKHAHLTHHVHNQSPADPKRYGVSRSGAGNNPDDCTLDRVPRILRSPIMLGTAITRIPLRIRHAIYLMLTFIVMGPFVLMGAGDFAIIGRSWKKRSTWVSAAGSVAVVAAIGLLSPFALAMAGFALWIGYSCISLAFITHLTPNQLFWFEDRRATPARNSVNNEAIR